MVLNNGKWDKKAKRDYLRKHGLLVSNTEERPTVRAHFVQNKFDQESDDEEKDEDKKSDEDENVEVNEEAINDFGDLEQADEIDSNAWRYKDLPENEDDFSLEELVSNGKTGLLDFKSSKDINRLKSVDLLSLKIGNNAQNSNSSHVKSLNPEEVEEFHRLQDQTRKLKEYRDLKLKFSDEQKQFDRANKRQTKKVLDLTAEDSFKDRVNQKIELSRRNLNKITDNDLHSDLNHLLGQDLSIEEEGVKPENQDFDDLFNSLSLKLNTSVSENHKSVYSKPDLKDEDFLDQLLA